MQGMFDDFYAGLGFIAGLFFGAPIVGALVAGGFGWWSLLAWPASAVTGLIAGIVLDRST